MPSTGAFRLGLALICILGLAACHRPSRPADRFAETVAPDSGFANQTPLTATPPPQPQPQAPGSGVHHPGRDHDRNGPLPSPVRAAASP